MTQLSAQRIVDAALDILRTYGLQDLSIRKVARTCGVQPGALYWYYPHKQALLGAVSHEILTREDLPLSPTPPHSSPHYEPVTPYLWEQAIAHTVLQLRERLLSVRDGTELVSASLAADTITPPQLADLCTALSFTGADAPRHARMIFLFSLGAVVEEQTRLQMRELAPQDNPVQATTPDTLLLGLQTIAAGLAARYPDATH